LKRQYIVLVALALIAVSRTVATYAITAQGFDENCHIAAAMEWLDKHTYTLDPVHPPLARVAIGLPLYLIGERYPELPAAQPDSKNYNVVGNSIIYGDGHYQRNLALGRSGILPFLVLAMVLVFLWTRRAFGDFAGVMAAALFSTLPTVLAFSGMAYTDLPAACMQFGSLFAFAIWLKNPSSRSTLLLGITLGLAVLSKLTIVLFFPAAALTILLCKWIVDIRQPRSTGPALSNWIGKAAQATVIVVFVVWGGYGFSSGRVRESMQVSPDNMPSFQHFPAPVRSLAREMVVSDWALPAPAFIRGFATAWTLNKIAPPSYVFGRTQNGGWWYFFLAALIVKTPLPFLVLSAIGLVGLVHSVRLKQWAPLAPAASAIGILLVTMTVSYDVGLRHVLVVLPLLAVAAGGGGALLWQHQGKYRTWCRALLAGLLLWQAISSFETSSDYIAYFNALAGSNPSEVLLTGCDLDCGQDLYRLSQVLRARQVAHANIAIWTSAEMSRVGLPEFSVPEPFQPVTGWVAISKRSLLLGDVFHKTYPPGAFAWLGKYQPVQRVGKTIDLYYIPGDAPAIRSRQATDLPAR
jgi:hypothetical protein